MSYRMFQNPCLIGSYKLIFADHKGFICTAVRLSLIKLICSKNVDCFIDNLVHNLSTD